MTSTSRPTQPCHPRLPPRGRQRGAARGVAPAGSRVLLLGLFCEGAQDLLGVVRLAHVRQQRVLGELGRGEVAEVLIDPVGHVGTENPLVPPRHRADLPHPCPRRVPVSYTHLTLPTIYSV